MIPYFLGIAALAGLGYTVLNFVDEYTITKNQDKFEIEFLDTHSNFLKEQAANVPLPLACKHVDVVTLLDLCTDIHKKWKVEYFYNTWIRKHEPSVSNHYLAFRRVSVKKGELPVDGVLVQVVRCNEKYAIFASDEKVGYVLTLAKKSAEGAESDTFYIYTKFEYMERPDYPFMEPLPANVEIATDATEDEVPSQLKKRRVTKNTE